MRTLRLITPQDAVLAAIRAIYDKHPWSTTLEAQDLGFLLYDLKYLPYCPALGDVYGAIEALSVEKGCPAEELVWHEVREVFGFRLIEIRAKATLRISGRVVEVKE